MLDLSFDSAFRDIRIVFMPLVIEKPVSPKLWGTINDQQNV